MKVGDEGGSVTSDEIVLGRSRRNRTSGGDALRRPEEASSSHDDAGEGQREAHTWIEEKKRKTKSVRG